MLNRFVQKRDSREPEGELAPDFRHIDAWIFDLDHTLYTMNDACQKGLEQRICRFVQQHLGLAQDPAFEIQKRYLRELGTTISGLVKFHGADGDAYHDFVNDLAELKLEADADLRAALARLPGRRFVFTNNCGRFAQNVVEALGVGDLIHDIVDAKALDYVAKPMPAAYDALLARTGIAPARAVLFDDSTRNLAPAHALGMTTVWVSGNSPWTRQGLACPDKSHIHHETLELSPFLHSVRI